MDSDAIDAAADANELNALDGQVYQVLPARTMLKVRREWAHQNGCYFVYLLAGTFTNVLDDAVLFKMTFGGEIRPCFVAAPDRKHFVTGAQRWHVAEWIERNCTGDAKVVAEVYFFEKNDDRDRFLEEFG